MTATQSNIIPFAFEDHLVRVYKPNGEPWFVGKDICAALDIRNHNDALKRLDDDERGTYTAGTPTKGVGSTDPLAATVNEQNVIIVSEAGVFRLVFTSRKPDAERFKRWLAHEVLPALRKHGSYTLPGRDDVPSSDPVTEFPTADGPLAEHMAKLATLRECRMIHGPRAAARLWRRLGMPQVVDSAIEEMDEGRRCLAHLLDTVVIEDQQFGDDRSLRDMIDICLEDNDHRVAQLLSDRYHLLVVNEGDGALFVPNEVGKLFDGTPWAKGRHRRALRLIREATPARRSMGTQLRGTLIPAAVLDSIVLPLKEGGNVAPMRT